MEETNIYKINLKCLINGSLEEDVEKDVNCKLYKAEVESIEGFSKRKIAEYLEKYMEIGDKWETIEIMVYWDKKYEFGYEITTGIPIPLLINDHITEDKYIKLARYGYFGQIQHHPERKKSQKNELEASKKHLNDLKEYIQDNSLETNSDIILFQTRLSCTIKNSQNYITETIKAMTRRLEKQNNDVKQKNNQFVIRMENVIAVYC